MRLGVFGGTFDPPHLGHLILAAEAHYQLPLDKVLWVLTPDPPHKRERKITPVHHRLDMVCATIRDNPNFELSRVEMDRPSPYYALDTVRTLHKERPDALLVYLMGGDSLGDLPTWHQPQEFVAACHEIGVIRRPGEDVDLQALDVQLPGLQGKVRFVDAPRLEISSSQIRQRAAEGGPLRYYVPLEVFQIIVERGLYRIDLSA